jgi:hypothetical protein
MSPVRRRRGTPVPVLERGSHLVRVEQAKWALENGADLVPGFKDEDRMHLHERLEALS